MPNRTSGWTVEEDVVETYIVTESSTMPPGFEFTVGETVEVQVRKGQVRAVRHDARDLWTANPEELAGDIKNGTLIKLNTGDWLPYIVTKPFFIGNGEFPAFTQVEIRYLGGRGLIRKKGSGQEIFFRPIDRLNLEAVPAVPATRPDPVLEGSPMQVAVTLMPIIKEVFPWVPGHAWTVTAPRGDNPKVGITGKLDPQWGIEIVLDWEGSVAILTENLVTVNEGRTYVWEKFRAILKTHCWADFVGWLSIVAGLVPHPVQVEDQTFLVIRPVHIASNRWEPGQVIARGHGEPENLGLDETLREQVVEGTIVPFHNGKIQGCEGCWHANNGCEKGDKCECFTLTEPPTDPGNPPRLQTHCPNCAHLLQPETRDGRVGKIVRCGRGNNPYSPEACSEFSEDIPF